MIARCLSDPLKPNLQLANAFMGIFGYKRMKPLLITIDPGLSGGFAFFAAGSVVAFPMPETNGDILAEIRTLKRRADAEQQQCVAYLELVPTGMPNRGASMSKLNKNASFIEGVIMSHDIRLILIRPAEWQSFFNLGKRSSCKNDYQWKKKLRGEAQRRFPQIKVTDETADALLIMEYALSAETERARG